MENKFVNYEQSVEVHKLGFRKSGHNGWNLDGLETAYQSTSKKEVFTWFENKRDLLYHIEKVTSIRYDYYIFSNRILVKDFGFETYEEAEDACIDKLIELAKQK